MAFSGYTEDGVLLVAQVRPKLRGWARVNSLIVNIGAYFLVAWLVMLLLPYAFGPQWAWGYWRVLAAVYIVRLVVGPKWPLLPLRDEVK